MVTAISAVLGLCNVVALAHHKDVGALLDHVRDHIAVLDELTDQTHAGDIGHLLLKVLERYLLAVAFFDDARDGFYSSRDQFDRAVIILLPKRFLNVGELDHKLIYCQSIGLQYFPPKLYLHISSCFCAVTNKN